MAWKLKVAAVAGSGAFILAQAARYNYFVLTQGCPGEIKAGDTLTGKLIERCQDSFFLKKRGNPVEVRLEHANCPLDIAIEFFLRSPEAGTTISRKASFRTRTI
ncbi:MAG TPA: hypothetical protein VH595_23100 [Verrucomicrobiae bacterium]|jgi:hypothetical protein|nr:hypothetical protein [Verrucomicrobiae bacterium]